MIDNTPLYMLQIKTLSVVPTWKPNDNVYINRQPLKYRLMSKTYIHNMAGINKLVGAKKNYTNCEE